jgi:DNA repair ATPase RecN
MEEFRIIPRLKMLQIHEVGPIQDLRLELGPAMNILTDIAGGGTGKTTILECAVAAVTGRYGGFTSAVRPQSKVVQNSAAILACSKGGSRR